jgi:hypothetical protein
MYCERHTLAATTDASGAATVYSSTVANGRVLQVRYVPGSTPIDTAGDIIISSEVTGVIVLDQDNIGTSAFTSAPRQATHLASTGAANLYAAGGTAVTDYVVLASERLKLVVASGGNVCSGTFYVYVG